MNKIIIISPYFGTLPDYIELWARSLEKNQEIDFVLFTDDKRSFYKPDNLKIVYMSEEELYSRCKNKLLIRQKMDPYKLCDLKPAYSILFEEYVEGYTHWGHCDIDLIFGDIKSFISEKLLNDYHKILDLGHFSIYKNCKIINNQYLNKCLGKKPFKNLVKSRLIKVFDENYFKGLGGINGILLENNFRLYTNRTIFIDAIPGLNKICDVNDIAIKNAYIHHLNDKLIVKWYRDNETDTVELEKEILYVHFQKRKISVPKDINSQEFTFSEIGISEGLINAFFNNEYSFDPAFLKNKKNKVIRKRFYQILESLKFIDPR